MNSRLPASTTKCIRKAGGKRIVFQKNGEAWAVGLGLLLYSAIALSTATWIGAVHAVATLIVGGLLTWNGRFLVLDTEAGTFYRFGSLPGTGSERGWLSDVLAVEIHRLVSIDYTGAAVSRWVVWGMRSNGELPLEFAQFGENERLNERMWGNSGFAEAWAFSDSLGRELGLPVRDRSAAGNLAQGIPTLGPTPEGAMVEGRSVKILFGRGAFVRFKAWIDRDRLFWGHVDPLGPISGQANLPVKRIRQINLFASSVGTAPCLRLETEAFEDNPLLGSELSLEECIWLRDWLHREIGQLN